MRHKPLHSDPIIRQYHPTVNGQYGAVTGFLLVWGTQSKVCMFADYTGKRGTQFVIWTVRFFGQTIEIIGTLRWQADSRGPIKELTLSRNDGKEFSESFRVFYLH